MSQENTDALQMLMCIPSHKLQGCGFSVHGYLPFGVTDFSAKERTPELEKNNRYLHLVAYVAVIIRNRNLILTYARQGTEGRLHGKRSIGVGGHIEVGTRGTLDQHCELEARREVEEELGFNTQGYPIEMEGLIQESITPVGRVHLGVCYTLYLDDIPDLTKGDGELADAKFEHLDNVLLHFEDYELWSQMYAGGLAKTLRLHY